MGTTTGLSKRQLKAARHRGRPQPSAPAVPEQDEPTPTVPTEAPVAGPSKRKRKREATVDDAPAQTIAPEAEATTARPSKKRFISASACFCCRRSLAESL